ncbi:sulfatase, partial [bacterium]|nr:sulfatase [bacterium]
IAAITVVGGTRNAWDFRLPVAFVIAVVAGLFVWVILRFVVGRRSLRAWSFANTVQWAVLPGLLVGLAVDAIAETTRAAWSEAAISGIAVLLLLGLALVCLRVGSPGRRQRLGWLPVLVAVAFVVCSCVNTRLYGTPNREGRPPGDTRAGRPDIILIVLDTLRADHLKSFGYVRDTMPALERWSRGGFVGKRVISPAGWTAPAHASIFSGRTVSLHGMHYTSSSEGIRTTSVENIAWLPDVLASEGYYCLAISANPGAVPSDITGFHRVLAPRRNRWESATLAARVDLRSPLTQRVSERMRWRMPYVDAEGIVAITKRAVPDQGPVFLFVNFLDPHGPYNPPVSALKLLGAEAPRAFSRYLGGCRLNRLWASLPDAKVEYLVDLYDGELRWLDLNLEELLSWIGERFGDDAIVIITSDHGEELGEEGRVGHEYGLSQRLIHVPLFVKGVGIPAGESQELITTRSIYDFACSCAAGEAPDVSVFARLDEHGMISERYVSGRNVEALGKAYDRSWVSVIEGNRKAVGPFEHGVEIYDIETAGFEREVPVSDTLAARRLGATVDAYWEENRDTRDDAFESLTDDEIEQLRALGYIQ